jgi:hypothetical protein
MGIADAQGRYAWRGGMRRHGIDPARVGIM